MLMSFQTVHRICSCNSNTRWKNRKIRIHY